MKAIVFSAFGGKLKSEPEMRPNEPYEIYMPVFKNEYKARCSVDKLTVDDLVTMRKALFRHSGKYEILPNKNTAAIYELEF